MKTRSSIISLIFYIVFAICVVALPFSDGNATTPAGVADDDIDNPDLAIFDLAKCTERQVPSGSTDMALLNSVDDLCYKRIFNQASINDFLIRRIRYIEQAYLDKVLLWMVVVITISGVLLSGLQLMISYKLAVAGKGGQIEPTDLSIDKDKLTLKSSLVGLSILAISLAFFIIYVFGVYTIKELGGESAGNASHTSSVGGLGVPPVALQQRE